MTRTELTISIILVAALLAVPAYFSTMALEHGKAHTQWENKQ